MGEITRSDKTARMPGGLRVAAAESLSLADQFEVMVYWMVDEPLLRGRSYLFQLGAARATATISPIKYRLDLRGLNRIAATRLERHDIGVCSIELGEPIAYHPDDEKGQPGFVLIDPVTERPVGVGLIRFALRRSQNVSWQTVEIDKHARSSAKRQRPYVIWLTGLSGSGKSTIANLVECKLHARGSHTYLLDGDNVRHGLNKDLGFTDADRVENIRRIAEVARLMLDAGLIVIVAFISPFATEREMARQLVDEGEFLEIFVDSPLELAEKRDPKGLYEKARSGQLPNFTGIDSPYEPPENPALRLDTAALAPEEAANLVIALLEQRGMLTQGRSPLAV